MAFNPEDRKNLQILLDIVNTRPGAYLHVLSMADEFRKEIPGQKGIGVLLDGELISQILEGRKELILDLFYSIQRDSDGLLFLPKDMTLQ